MSKYGIVKSPKAWKNKWGVSEINYSILLAHVFGEPIKTEKAFMYLFRRYGLPSKLYDDYKDLCEYTFHTNDKDIIVRWRMNHGDYHFHLCTFANESDWHNYSTKPIDDYYKQIQAAAEKDGLVYFGGWHPLFNLWRERKDGKTEFLGNDIQRAAIDKMCEEYQASSEEEKAQIWSKVFKRMTAHDKEMREKYSDIIRPVIETAYDKSFLKKRHKQVEAGKEQHDWILSLPDGHFLRRVYFAAMGLFENWKRPTYIRDVYFDMSCEEPESIKKVVSYTDFSKQMIVIKGENHV